jgi:tetratricopeptide (TPR) repeat protein
MGAIAHDTSRWEESTALYRRGLELADRIGDRSLGALMKFNFTEILIDRGLYDEAEPQIREVIRLWRAAGAEADVAEANRELARLLARRGQFAEAETLLDGARDYQVGAAKAAEVLRTDVRRIELSLLEGDPDKALQLLGSADRMASTTDGGTVVEPTLARLRGSAYAQQGRTADAEERLRWAVSEARHRDERFEEALALDALVTLGERAGAVDADVVQARDLLFKEMGITVAPAFSTGFVPG